jgi:putative endonuclease
VSLAGKAWGRLGEALAEEHLRGLGWQILERNWVSPAGGELDLVARDKGTLVFVEVKAFASSAFGESPAVNVTPAKQRRVVRAARGYLCQLGREKDDCRFDVVAVQLDPAGGPAQVERFEGAFSA